MSEAENKVIQTPGRFELHVGDQVAFIQYRVMHSIIVMTHTEVPVSLEGGGVGAALVKGALELVKAQEAQIVPSCPFVAAYIKRHQEYQPLVFPLD